MTNEVGSLSTPKKSDPDVLEDTKTALANAAGSYVHDLMQGSVPSSHPSHRFEIALGYFRGNPRSMNKQ